MNHTLFVSALLALAISGCGSDESSGQATCQDCLATGGSAGMAGSGGASGGGTGGTAGQAGSGGVTLTPADVLVDSAWLEAHEGSSDVQLVDVRTQSAYDAGHLPGALHVDPSSLSASANGVSNMLVAPDAVASILGSAGVDRDKIAVVYGTEVDTSTARVFWALDYEGQPELRLLDGGYSAWVAASGATETTSPTAAPTSYPSTAISASRKVDLAWMSAHYADETVAVIDARSAAEYSAGHIPGALNVDWQANVSAGSLKPPGEVQALYAAVPADKTVVTYCQSGSRASVAYFVLRWLGYPDVRLYDGSWAEWGAQANTPKE